MVRQYDRKPYFCDTHFSESCLQKTIVVAKVCLLLTLKLHFVHVNGPWKEPVYQLAKTCPCKKNISLRALLFKHDFGVKQNTYLSISLPY